MGWLKRLLARLRPEPPDIRPDEDVLFLDVRTRAEFNAGHARGAVHIPFNQVPERLPELEEHRDRRILVYCLSGTRAASAARTLRGHGFQHVENARSLGAIRRAGIDIERGS